jgi:hypothetical protein
VGRGTTVDILVAESVANGGGKSAGVICRLDGTAFVTGISPVAGIGACPAAGEAVGEGDRLFLLSLLPQPTGSVAIMRAVTRASVTAATVGGAMRRSFSARGITIRVVPEC